MNRLRAMIVDDEPLMCDELRCILEPVRDIEVAAIVYNPLDAEKIAAAKPFDVIFLDIQMPGMSGLELAKRLSSAPQPPLIVFVTAHSDFAIDAFGVDAVDYILKPFDEADIARALKKVRLWQRIRKEAHAPLMRSPVRKLCVEAGDRLEVIDVNRIQLIQAGDRQVSLRTIEGGVYTLRQRLSELEAMLDPKEFYRCHRNFIVNVNQIRQIAHWFNRGYLLILQDPPAEIPVGRVYAPKLKEYLPL